MKTEAKAEENVSWVARIRGSLRRAHAFASRDLWNTDLASLPGPLGFLFRMLRIVILVVKGVRDDDLKVRAAALTFTSLMSLVPMLAVAFSLLKGFGVGDSEIERIMEWAGTMPEQFQHFLDQIMDLAQRTSFAALGWIGLGVLLSTAVALFGSVELSVNRVWGINRPRPFLRRAANFISMLVVVPILIGIAGTVAATLRSEALIERLGAAAAVYRGVLSWTPFLMCWLAFVFLYSFLPNTRVRWLPAVISGLVGAVLWLAWQNAYIALQLGVGRYNAIYGTFASIPIFLFWLYVSWVIVLLGAEVTFAVQYHDTLHLEQLGEKASPVSRVLISLAMMKEAVLHQLDLKGPFDAHAFAHGHRVPVRLVNDLMTLLVEHGWMVPVGERPGRYALLAAPDRLAVDEVVRLVVEEGASPEALGLDRLDVETRETIAAFTQGLIAAGAGRTLRQMSDGKPRE